MKDYRIYSLIIRTDKSATKIGGSANYYGGGKPFERMGHKAKESTSATKYWRIGQSAAKAKRLTKAFKPILSNEE